jgi:glutathione S-transferase
MFVPGCVEPAIIDRRLERPPGPARSLGYGEIETMVEVMAKALASGPYLLGEQFTAADVMMGSAVRWAMFTKLLPERPEFLGYAGRLSERPALRRTMEQEAALAPRQPR